MLLRWRGNSDEIPPSGPWSITVREKCVLCRPFVLESNGGQVG